MQSRRSNVGTIFKIISFISLFFIVHCGQGEFSSLNSDSENSSGVDAAGTNESNGKNATPNFEVRSIDATGNNFDHNLWGSAGTSLKRLAPSAYADGISAPAGENRPSPREISNGIIRQDQSIPNNRNLSSFVFAWGQFLDHDIDLTLTDPNESLPILVPLGDPFFDPQSSGTETLDFFRSVFDIDSGIDGDNPRQQTNVITAFIDGSQVYGSDTVRATWLRTGVGGKLKTSEGDMMPFNDGTQSNAPNEATVFFLGGDIRANETVTLSALHTLFVREHNRLCDEIAVAHPDWDDEQVYQHARRWVGAFLQSVTFNEFLPALLGPHAPGPYRGYDSAKEPAIFNEFSTALFRVGHTMLPSELLLADDAGLLPLSLQNAFFNPDVLLDEGIGPILSGLALNPIEEIDPHLVSEVRNFLFGAPGDGGLDLASLNLQRGRDHGLPDYNSYREALGLKPIADFSKLTDNANWQAAFQDLYGTVDDVDLWVAALAEDHLPAASVGETISRTLNMQFEALRRGDRFWYENDSAFTEQEVHLIRNTKLSQIILRNTSISSLPANVFRIPDNLN